MTEPLREQVSGMEISPRGIGIRMDPGELIVGNRTAGVRAGVVFPEAEIYAVYGRDMAGPTALLK